ncbi:ATP-dependent 6-phosphofructokinase [Zobellia barbeyronii]|uniref:ATP-dependent 6-phosphofructokinase n=1 Tax=Zobellia barbeyronii TaxID=2748009 RepID=A0ABS5WN46_9FLAO|nr:ATP-dependent 6-phosphofructokinase [Zobellia barbeyronii]MBT2163537.1 ATP-dependent 6-phosphofructokinase [Zobellia barbeyronii]
MSSETNFNISSLGANTFSSPINLSKTTGDKIFNFVEEHDRILADVSLESFNTCIENKTSPACLEKAGPREKLFFDSKKTTAAIVSCGGLCPGINNVIRGLVMALHYFYGVKRILGVQYGYEGLIPENGHEFIDLVPDKVKDIHEFGGTILGSSRGAQSVEKMVDSLVKNKIDLLFTIGGDGTLKGANAIGDEIEKRGLDISIIGIPKTIDNDIDLIDKSFGFETSFDVASPIIRDAHNEATGAFNGISIVKLMGRDSGFIAASTAIAMPVVNFVFVPEMDFQLEGENGFLEALKKRLNQKRHAVIVVAEGAGQHLFGEDSKTYTDASGNIIHQDIGLLLKHRIKAYFDAEDMKCTIKYIDPSYIIRSAPANANDSLFCNRLAYHAVHGAMAGKTKFVVGRLNNKFVYLPILKVVNKRKKINMEGEFWFSVLQSTGQPFTM